MAGKKEVERCSGGLVLDTNAFTRELEKLVKVVIGETKSFVNVCKPDSAPEVGSNVTVLPQLAGDRLIRLKEVLKLVPIGRSTWYAGVKSGIYPAPVTHLGPRISAWKLGDIIELINGKGASNE